MTPMERAQTYASIFLNVGDRWRGFVPVDATVTGERVHIGGIELRPDGDVWRLTTNGQTWTMRKAVPA